jgi:hypothetical protein
MGLHTATGLNRWVKSAEAKTLHASRLNIGPRLILGFVFIILSMFAAVTNAKTCLRWLGRDQPDVAEAREAASRIVTDVTRAADIISSAAAKSHSQLTFPTNPSPLGFIFQHKSAWRCVIIGFGRGR